MSNDAKQDVALKCVYETHGLLVGDAPIDFVTSARANVRHLLTFSDIVPAALTCLGTTLLEGVPSYCMTGLE
jgi:hypothetical protein